MDKVFVTVTRHTITVGNKLFPLVHKSLDSFEIKFRKKVDLEPETDIIQCVAIDKNGLFHILREFDKIKQQIKRQESIDETVEEMVLPKVSSESE